MLMMIHGDYDNDRKRNFLFCGCFACREYLKAGYSLSKVPSSLHLYGNSFYHFSFNMLYVYFSKYF